MVPGSAIASSSALLAIVKLDKVVMLVDSDGGAEDLGLPSKEISGEEEGKADRWDCSATPGSPRDIATGVAAGSRN
jgi:hypothetical protein